MPREQQSPGDPPRILFCPFCRDGFEERDECPEHELILVPLDELPPHPDGRPDGVTFFADPRFGRGGVLLGASLVLLGFLIPFVASRGVVASALEVAIDGATNLWLTPGAALGQLGILWRRRSGTRLRAARAAVLGLAVGGALPLLYSTRRIATVAEGYAADIDWLWGLWVMAAGLALTATASRRLGTSTLAEAD